jgi:tetrapyrrole methylase family protein/MazG family protein
LPGPLPVSGASAADVPVSDVPVSDVPVVTVVGLGPGRPGLVTSEALEALRSAKARWLRTTRHPSASLVEGTRSFDYLYDSAASLEEVYEGIVQALVVSAASEGGVVYAVPGSPSVAERSVELLRADPRVRTEVLPGVSFADLAFERLGVDPLAVGVTIVDGQRFALDSAGRSGPLLVGQCDSAHVLSEVKLAIAGALEGMVQGGPPPEVVVLQRLGLADEAVFTVPWDELDRSVDPDHLTSIWVPELGAPFASEFVRLEELGRTLRERCPWDRQQTHDSLTRYLLEEAYETLEAIEELGPDGTGYEHLEEELGDVLFQVVAHSVIAAEEGQFALGDVARRVHDKLVRRHPHVFGEVVANSAEDVSRNWEQIKRRERAERGWSEAGAGEAGAGEAGAGEAGAGKAGAGEAGAGEAGAGKAGFGEAGAGGRMGEYPSLMDGLPRNLPALLYAHKVQGRAASAGFDWEGVEGALAKVDEELAELQEALEGGAGKAAQREELGDLLFAAVNLARKLDVDPEAALREAAAKFRRRFRAVEELAHQRGDDLSELGLEGLDRLWDEVKATEAG